jgi:hypothetical protein
VKKEAAAIKDEATIQSEEKEKYDDAVLDK